MFSVKEDHILKKSMVPLLLFLLLFILVRTQEQQQNIVNELDVEENTKNTDISREKGGLVYILNEKNFELFFNQHPTALVEFYAPWCGHCKQLDPEYEKAAKLIADNDKIALAKVDATVETKLATRFKIQGYPTLKFWKEGQKEPIDYDGDREAEDIVKWIKEKMDPSYKPPVAEEVVALTRDIFDEFVGNKPLVLVEFYAPWCGHCKQLAPEFEKAAIRLKEYNIPLAKVDATVENKLAEEYGIKGYPTLKILRNGRRFDYNGPREADGIVNYMLEQAKPAAQLLATKEVQKLLAIWDIAIIGFFKMESGPLYEAFVNAAERTRGDFRCAFVTDPELTKHFKANPEQIVIYYPEIFWSKFEPKKKVYPKKSATTEELITFWRVNATPMVGLLTRMTFPTRYTKRPLVVVYYNVDFSIQYREGTQYWRNKILEIANKYKPKKFHFAVADEEEFEEELKAVGLGASGLEHNVIVFGVDGKKYPMDPEKYDEELEENLNAFLEDIGKGKVKPFLKSQPVPKEDKKNPVLTVVANNFDKIVNDESNDVIIEFYAPWCGHCKAFEPKYKQFAAKYTKEEPNLVIAKFDATENDVPEKFIVDGFPTIYFVPSGKKKEPIKYNGNRDIEDLIKFMRQHAVKSFQQKEKKAGKEEL